MTNPRNIHFNKGDLVKIPEGSYSSVAGQLAIIKDVNEHKYRNGKMYSCFVLNDNFQKFGVWWIHDYELIEDYYGHDPALTVS